jgi:hypothetical protein
MTQLTFTFSQSITTGIWLVTESDNVRSLSPDSGDQNGRIPAIWLGSCQNGRILAYSQPFWPDSGTNSQIPATFSGIRPTQILTKLSRFRPLSLNPAFISESGNSSRNPIGQ